MGGQRPQPRGGELDGERDAVECAADAGDRLDVGGGDSIAGPNSLSTLCEEPDRGVFEGGLGLFLLLRGLRRAGRLGRQGE